MKIADLIEPDQVAVGLRASDKAQLLKELAQRASAVLPIDQSVILDAIQAREKLGSTGLGKGLAVPHARLNKVSAPFVLFVRLAKPIDFQAVDDRPVDLVIMLLTGTNAGNQHLAILATLSRPLRDEAFVRRLREAPDRAALHALLASV
jgi:PTS system nitrogen regulatory IIA component